MLKKILATIMMVFIINIAIMPNINVSFAQSKGEVPGKALGF